MDAKTISLCILMLSDEFDLVSLGLLLIRTSSAVKEATVLMTMLETTIDKVNHILDDVNTKLELLNTPVEIVSGIFSRGFFGSGLFSIFKVLGSLFKRKK